MGQTFLPAIAQGQTFADYVMHVNKIPSLEAGEEYTLATQYEKTGDITVAHKLITSHLKLVVKIARSFYNYGLALMDLVSEGNIGLMHAVKKFRPSLGYRLSTYAMWWIKASIQEFILRSWSMVRIGSSTTQKKIFFALRKLRRKIELADNRDIIDDGIKKLAEDLDVSERDVFNMNMRLSRGSDSSLNDKLYNAEDRDMELIDTIESADSNHELILASQSELRYKQKLLQQALQVLSTRDKDIILARYINNTTLKTLSKKYSISMERIRQITENALRKIKEYVRQSLPALEE